jgi:hypothetical protein
VLRGRTTYALAPLGGAGNRDGDGFAWARRPLAEAGLTS